MYGTFSFLIIHIKDELFIIQCSCERLLRFLIQILWHNGILFCYVDTAYIAGFKCMLHTPCYCFEQIVKLDLSLVLLVFVISHMITG